MKTPEDFAIDFMQHMKVVIEGGEPNLPSDQRAMVDSAASVQLAWVQQRMLEQAQGSVQIGANSFIPQGPTPSGS